MVGLSFTLRSLISTTRGVQGNKSSSGSRGIRTQLIKIGINTGQTLAVDGGMVQNLLLMQMQADIAQIQVKIPAMLESTALGAAVCAGAAVGGGLAALVLLLFLRSPRATLVVSLAIPVSIVATFVAGASR